MLKLNGKELTKFSKLPAGNGETPAASLLFSNERGNILDAQDRCISAAQPQLRGTTGSSNQDSPASPQMNSLSLVLKVLLPIFGRE